MVLIKNNSFRKSRIENNDYLTSLVALLGKESACNAGDLGSIPGLGRFPGEGNGDPLQCPARV